MDGMKSQDHRSPEYYHEQARCLRELVKPTTTEAHRKRLEDVALEYERLAVHAERRRRIGR